MAKLISEEVKFDGVRFNVVQKVYQDENGKTYVRDCVNPGDAAVILPIDENNNVVFVKQIREAVGFLSLELPAGMVDPGEEPIDTARRELEEETGIRAKTVEHLISVYPSSGYTSERVHIFYAKDFQKGNQKLDDTEHIEEIERIPLDRCLDLSYTCAFIKCSGVDACQTFRYRNTSDVRAIFKEVITYNRNTFAYDYFFYIC